MSHRPEPIFATILAREYSEGAIPRWRFPIPSWLETYADASCGQLHSAILTGNVSSGPIEGKWSTNLLLCSYESSSVIETFIIVIPLMLSPGPANLVSFLLGTRHGVTQLIPFQLGILLVYGVVAIGLGFLGGRIADFSLIAGGTLQVVGGLFIIYLGIQLFRRKKREAEERYPTFFNGIMLQCLNPKFPGVVLAVFANRHSQPTLMTASTICVVGAVGLLTYAIAGSLLRDRHASGRRFEVVGMISGVLLCLVGLWFVLQALLNK